MNRICLARAGTYLGLLFSLSACTSAKDLVVRMLSADAAFQATSPSPYDQENDDGSVRMRGLCLPNTQKLQLRWESLDWIDVPASAPSPDASEDETTPVDTTYDVNCADGRYDFYLYKTTLVQLYAALGVTMPDDDPTSLSIRPVGPGYVGDAITFEPTPASSIALDWQGAGGDNAKVVAGAAVPLVIRLRTASGKSTREVHTLSFTADVVSDPGANVSATGTGAGGSTSAITFYECDPTQATCAQGSEFSTSSSSDELKVWTRAPTDAGAADQYLRVHVACASSDADCGLTAAAVLVLQIRASSNVQTSFSTGDEPFPAKIARGATYPLAIRFQTYGGSLSYGPFQSLVGASPATLALVSPASACSSVAGSQALDCNFTQGVTPAFTVTVPATSNASTIGLSVSDAGTSIATTIRHDARGMAVAVDPSGSTNYVAPSFTNAPSEMSPGSCQELWVAAGNENGTALPLTADKIVRVELRTGAGDSVAGTLISGDSGCAGTPATVQSVTLSATKLLRRVYLSLPSGTATGSYRLVVTEMDGDVPVTRADGSVIHSVSILRVRSH